MSEYLVGGVAVTVDRDVEARQGHEGLAALSSRRILFGCSESDWLGPRVILVSGPSIMRDWAITDSLTLVNTSA